MIVCARPARASRAVCAGPDMLQAGMPAVGTPPAGGAPLPGAAAPAGRTSHQKSWAVLIWMPLVCVKHPGPAPPPTAAPGSSPAWPAQARHTGQLPQQGVGYSMPMTTWGQFLGLCCFARSNGNSRR